MRVFALFCLALCACTWAQNILILDDDITTPNDPDDYMEALLLGEQYSVQKMPAANVTSDDLQNVNVLIVSFTVTDPAGNSIIKQAPIPSVHMASDYWGDDDADVEAVCDSVIEAQVTTYTPVADSPVLAGLAEPFQFGTAVASMIGPFAPGLISIVEAGTQPVLAELPKDANRLGDEPAPSTR